MCIIHSFVKTQLSTVLISAGILHGAGLWQLPKQLYLPTEEKSALAPNSHLKYVWYDLQPLFIPANSSFTFAQLFFKSGTCVLASASLLLLDSHQDLLFFSSPLPLIILLFCFKKERKKKPWRVHYLPPHLPPPNKPAKMFDLDPTHGSQLALPCSHRAMLKGFYKHSAKAAS